MMRGGRRPYGLRALRSKTERRDLTRSKLEPTLSVGLLVEPNAEDAHPADADSLRTLVRVEDAQDDPVAVLGALEAAEDNIAVELERRFERLTGDEVRAVVLCRAQQFRIRKSISVEAERVLEAMATQALAFGCRDRWACGDWPCREARRARDRSHAAEQGEPNVSVGAGLVLGQALREQRERAERDGAERVRGRHRRLDPTGSRRWRLERPADDGELALRPHLVRVRRNRKPNAQAMIRGGVLDSRTQLDALDTARQPDGCVNANARQLGVENKLGDEGPVSQHARIDQSRLRDRTAGTEGVEVSDIRLVLNRVQAGEAAAVAQIGDGERAIVFRRHVQRAVRDRRSTDSYALLSTFQIDGLSR